MRRLILEIALVAVLVGALGGPAPGQEEKKDALAAFQEAFDRKFNGELDRQAEKARNLRVGYLAALEKLKATLGRENNLKGAAQVLLEIETITDGEETEDLPEDADHRLKNLRVKWDRGLKELHDDGNRGIADLARTYFRALEKEKQRLTRAGKIKEALAMDEELNRVKELPEIAQALGGGGAEPSNGDEEKGDLALRTKGARVTGAEDGKNMIDGEGESGVRSDYAWGVIPCEFKVDLRKVRTLERIRLLLFDLDNRSYLYRLSVSADGKNWETVKDASKERASSWQEVKFQPREVRYIRINGLSNTANNNFHVVELEAYGSGS